PYAIGKSASERSRMSRRRRPSSARIRRISIAVHFQPVGHRMKPLELIPPAWCARLAKARVEEIRSGLGGASVFRVEGASGQKQFLKIAQGEEAKALHREIERTSWLRSQGINVPETLDVSADAHVTALLMSAVSGAPADESLGTPSETIGLVGCALA